MSAPGFHLAMYNFGLHVASYDAPEVQGFPRFIEGSGFDSGPSSLLMWADIESLMAFSYSGVHAEALKNARNWNTKNDWPPLVLWWLEAGLRPDWERAAERLEWLHDNGASPRAFTFKQAYDPEGNPLEIDRARVKALMEMNAPGQSDLLAKLQDLPV